MKHRPYNICPTGGKNISQILRFPATRLAFFFLLFSFLPLTPVLASEPKIDIIDTWVEDGFLFHVAYQASPSNLSCPLVGEGLIEFEVTYEPRASEIESVFSLALWYPSSKSNMLVETHAKAIGPQALCTKFSPCRIQAIKVLKTYCPINPGPLFLD